MTGISQPMVTRLEGKHIILGVCGGIAAYKSLELLRLLKRQGADVRVIMTRNAQWFVGSKSFEALSGLPVCTSLFENDADGGIHHIAWAESADLVVIAPATANLLAKMANGLADDALSTFLLAVTCPVILCPSMNSRMYENSAVRRNLARLAQDGHTVLTPDAGDLACGTTGPGRLPEPPLILERVLQSLSPKDFLGKRVVVTAGPTFEPMDPVRFIGNPSSGKMGFALARAAVQRGAQVILVSGPTALSDPPGACVVRVRTAEEMARAVLDHARQADIVIKAAAVSDYRPADTAAHKMKKSQETLTLHLRRTPDILSQLGKSKGHRILVGFAAETQDLERNAFKKLVEKNLDIIVGNMVGGPDSGFGSDTNTATLFYTDGTQEPLAPMKKEMLAHLLLDRITQRFIKPADPE